MAMSYEEAQAALKKYGSQRKAAEALGIARSTLRVAAQRTPSGVKPVANPIVRDKKSLTDFKNTYDKDTIVPQKIKSALAELGDSWEYEINFAKAAGVSMQDISNYREMFTDYIVTIRRDNKRAWTGSKSVASKMREMVA